MQARMFSGDNYTIQPASAWIWPSNLAYLDQCTQRYLTLGFAPLFFQLDVQHNVLQHIAHQVLIQFAFRKDPNNVVAYPDLDLTLTWVRTWLSILVHHNTGRLLLLTEKLSSLKN